MLFQVHQYRTILAASPQGEAIDAKDFNLVRCFLCRWSEIANAFDQGRGAHRVTKLVCQSGPEFSAQGETQPSLMLIQSCCSADREGVASKSCELSVSVVGIRGNEQPFVSS